MASVEVLLCILLLPLGIFLHELLAAVHYFFVFYARIQNK